MSTQRDRREAAEILRRIVAALPNPTPVQRAFLLGQASGLDEGITARGREPTGRRHGGEDASLHDAG
jgi:hypothetical protein